MTGRRAGNTPEIDLPTPVHCNGNVICSIDVETTGLVAGHHDMVQIAIVVLNEKYEPNKAINPFYTDLKPIHPERADPKAMKVNKLSVDDLLINGIEPWDAADIFGKWFEKLNLGSRKRIMPLGYNYPFDASFIRAWLGDEEYEHYFHYEIRDAKPTVMFLNDRAWWKADRIPFPKTSLTYVASQLGIPTDRSHDALGDAVTAAAVWKTLLRQLL